MQVLHCQGILGHLARCRIHAFCRSTESLCLAKQGFGHDASLSREARSDKFNRRHVRAASELVRSSLVYAGSGKPGGGQG